MKINISLLAICFMPDYTKLQLADSPKVSFNLDGRILYSSDKYQLIHLAMRPGEEMEMHVQPMDVLFFVVEGEGSLIIGEEVVRAAANMTIHVKAGSSRAWKNSGEQTLKILVNKLLA